MSSKKRVRKVS